MSDFLFIVHEYPPIVGGAGIFVKDMVDELSKENSITVITASPTSKTIRIKQGNQTLIKVGVPFRNKEYHYATGLSLVCFTLRGLYCGWTLRKQPFQAIHAYYLFPAGLIAVILSKWLKVPCAVTAIGGEVYDPRQTGVLVRQAELPSVPLFYYEARGPAVCDISRRCESGKNLLSNSDN